MLGMAPGGITAPRCWMTVPASVLPALLAQAIASPNVKLVTLTITEKGYCLDAQQSNLNVSDPDVSADCENLEQPKTAIGYLVAGLAKRQQAGSGGITILSCDNLSHNGDCTRRAVLAMANAHSTALGNWIATHVSFPNAMVYMASHKLKARRKSHGEAVEGLAFTDSKSHQN